MGYSEGEIIGLLNYAAQRLFGRMNGLTDDEWAWQPIAEDERITVRWRLDHIAQAVGGERNWIWMGADAAEAPNRSPAGSAQVAVATVRKAIDLFVALTEGVDLSASIGPIGGRYATEPRRSLVLHTTDELIHHAAEVALLRDLYAGHGRSG